MRVGQRFNAAYLFDYPFNRMHRPRIAYFSGRTFWLLASLAAGLGCLMEPHLAHDRRVQTALWLWFMILLPYILISFYNRYAVPIIGLQAFVMIRMGDVVASTLMIHRCRLKNGKTQTTPRAPA